MKKEECCMCSENPEDWDNEYICSECLEMLCNISEEMDLLAEEVLRWEKDQNW